MYSLSTYLHVTCFFIKYLNNLLVVARGVMLTLIRFKNMELAFKKLSTRGDLCPGEGHENPLGARRTRSIVMAMFGRDLICIAVNVFRLNDDD